MASVIKEKEGGPLWTPLYKELRAEILSRNLRDGSKLSESYVCKKYGVSRTPVREALFQLEAEGLIKIIPNRGAFVTGLTDRDISDIFDMRCLLEAQAAEWAVMRMSAEEIDKLSEALDFMELYTLRGDAARILEFNSEFHNIIYDGCRDRMIQNTLKTYHTYLKNALPPVSYSKAQLRDIFKEHKAIYLAFEAKNAVTARKVMEEHVRHSKARRMIDYEFPDKKS